MADAGLGMDDRATMWDAAYLHERAQQCQAMARIAARTDLRDSLIQLANEFEEEAERLEREEAGSRTR